MTVVQCKREGCVFNEKGKCSADFVVLDTAYVSPKTMEGARVLLCDTLKER